MWLTKENFAGAELYGVWKCRPEWKPTEGAWKNGCILKFFCAKEFEQVIRVKLPAGKTGIVEVEKIIFKFKKEKRRGTSINP